MTLIDQDMYHTPVLLHEAVEGLAIRPEGKYADLTFGGGGHSAEILKHIGPSGKLIAFDQDEDALRNRLDDSRFILIQSNFRFARNFLSLYKLLPLQGVLLDLGVSSHQFDLSSRGFSTRFDAPLDMRMNKASKLTAAKIINQYSEEQLRAIFKNYGEVANAHALAANICAVRQTHPIESTLQLLEVLNKLTPKNKLNKYAAQVFQALRIEVNEELVALKEILQQMPLILEPGGRLVVISYHSLEDRFVKNVMRCGNTDGRLDKDFFGNVRVPFRPVNKKPILPSSAEIAKNPRSRSAKLRVAERTDV